MPELTFDMVHAEKIIEELYAETGGFSIDKARVLSLISPGVLVKTQVANSFRWNVNTIRDIKGDILTIPFVSEDTLFIALADDVVRFRLSVDKYDLNFLSSIRDIECISPLPVMVLKVFKVEIWRNKRGSTRHNAGFLCRSVSEMQEKFVSYLTNISDSGGGIICRENLRIGSNVKLSFFGPDETLLELVATVVRSKKVHDSKVEYGIRFFDVSPGVSKKIQEILEDERISENRLYLDICKKYSIKPLF